MSKIVFVFLALCLINIITASSGSTTYGYPSSEHIDSYHPTTFIDIPESSDHLELYSTFANSIFDFVAKIVRAKVEVVLWMKRYIITMMIRSFASLRHLMIHNADFVNGIIHTVAELLKVLLTNKPHFAVPHVQRVLADATHEYIPHY